jgi:hypothetical protein
MPTSSGIPIRADEYRLAKGAHTSGRPLLCLGTEAEDPMGPLFATVENIPLPLGARNSAVGRFACKSSLSIARMRFARLRALRAIVVTLQVIALLRGIA